MSELTYDDVFSMWDELRSMAQRLLSAEGKAHSVQPSDLVLTALRRQKPGGWKIKFDAVEVTWENRAELFRNMRIAMSQALVDYSRKRKRVRQIKTEPLGRFDPTDFRETVEERPELLEAVHLALEALRQVEPRWAELIENQYYLGFSQKAAAREMNISVKTARRWFNRARVMLVEEINRYFGHSSE